MAGDDDRGGEHGSDDAATEDGAFRTIGGQGEADFEVAGSAFVGYASPVDSVDAAEAFVAEVREAHPDATHLVPAYRVRDADVLREYASDADEPSGSAGKPALNVLAGRDLENVAVAIARYFGGTELGVGGLARAYGRAAKLAVDAAGVVEDVPHERLVVDVAYDDSGTVRGILESEGVEFEADYGERARFSARVPAVDVGRVSERLRSATSGRAEPDVDGG